MLQVEIQSGVACVLLSGFEIRGASLTKRFFASNPST